jgi:hypothetical protein
VNATAVTPVNGQARPVAARARGQQTPPPNPETIMGELQDWYRQLERTWACYNHLNTAFQAHTGELPPGVLAKSLPLFKMTASVNGRDAIECIIDTKKVNEEHVAHVLIPLINVQQADLISSLEEISTRVASLHQFVVGSMMQQTQAPAETQGAT